VIRESQIVPKNKTMIFNYLRNNSFYSFPKNGKHSITLEKKGAVSISEPAPYNKLIAYCNIVKGKFPLLFISSLNMNNHIHGLEPASRPTFLFCLHITFSPVNIPLVTDHSVQHQWHHQNG
jgi:hypothetical protein